VLQKEKNKEFRVFGQLFAKQASKQASNLENKTLRYSCSFKKIVNKVDIVVARGQSDLWSLWPFNSFLSPFFIVYKFKFIVKKLVFGGERICEYVRD